ncbi:hypothetical protein C8R47DRAFT_812574 [Mycena vitilis]|nr:hypothetical protein C8R47DRAFT_812574 [Mycena vitilis]
MMRPARCALLVICSSHICSSWNRFLRLRFVSGIGTLRCGNGVPPETILCLAEPFFVLLHVQWFVAAVGARIVDGTLIIHVSVGHGVDSKVLGKFSLRPRCVVLSNAWASGRQCVRGVLQAPWPLVSVLGSGMGVVRGALVLSMEELRRFAELFLLPLPRDAVELVLSLLFFIVDRYVRRRLRLFITLLCCRDCHGIGGNGCMCAPRLVLHNLFLSFGRVSRHYILALDRPRLVVLGSDRRRACGLGILHACGLVQQQRPSAIRTDLDNVAAVVMDCAHAMQPRLAQDYVECPVTFEDVKLRLYAHSAHADVAVPSPVRPETGAIRHTQLLCRWQ